MKRRMFPVLALSGLGMCSLPQSVLSEGIDERVRGLVRSSARISMRTDLVASVKSAPFDDGARFKKGDKLIVFDCGRYFAGLRASKAAANAAQIELRNKKRLYANGATGKSEVQMANAEALRMNAEKKVQQVRVRDCTIVAPFSGRVVNLNVRRHEMPTPNEPIIVVLDDSVLELELVISSKWLRWVKPGKSFEFEIDETGSKHDAEITHLGAEVDPVSQTIKAYGKLKGDLATVLAGMSGTAYFAPKVN